MVLSQVLRRWEEWPPWLPSDLWDTPQEVATPQATERGCLSEWHEPCRREKMVMLGPLGVLQTRKARRREMIQEEHHSFVPSPCG